MIKTGMVKTGMIKTGMIKTGLIKRSFALAGHRTSVALEPEFWAALEALALMRGCKLTALLAEADATREPGSPLASVLRVMALRASRS